MNLFVESHQKLLIQLTKAEVDFIIIGGYSVIFHGYARTTLPKPLAQASSIPACAFTSNRLRVCLHTRLFYSYLNESDGLVVAALNACKPTMAIASTMKNTEGSTYVSTPGVIWYSKLASHSPMA